MTAVYRGFGARHPAQAFGLRRGVFQRELLPGPVVGILDGFAAAAHDHTVVRTPNGGDYGRDLLRQHYERAHGGAHHCPA